MQGAAPALTLPSKQEQKEAEAFLTTGLVMVLLPALLLLLASMLLLTLSPRLTEDTAGQIAPFPRPPNKGKDALGVAKFHCRDQ